MRRGIHVTVVLITVVLIIAVLASGPAAAKSPPVTSMRFKIAEHSVLVGETIQGTVHVVSKTKGVKTPLGGVTLSVRLGKTEVGTVVTDAKGNAVIMHVAGDSGEHVLRVVFAGDDAHKRAQRAQGFSATESPEPEPEPEPVD